MQACVEMAMQVGSLWHLLRNPHQLAAINAFQVTQEMLAETATVGGGDARVRSLALPDALHYLARRALELGSSGNSLSVEGYTTILG